MKKTLWANRILSVTAFSIFCTLFSNELAKPGLFFKGEMLHLLILVFVMIVLQGFVAFAFTWNSIADHYRNVCYHCVILLVIVSIRTFGFLSLFERSYPFTNAIEDMLRAMPALFLFHGLIEGVFFLVGLCQKKYLLSN